MANQPGGDREEDHGYMPGDLEEDYGYMPRVRPLTEAELAIMNARSSGITSTIPLFDPLGSASLINQLPAQDSHGFIPPNLQNNVSDGHVHPSPPANPGPLEPDLNDLVLFPPWLDGGNTADTQDQVPLDNYSAGTYYTTGAAPHTTHGASPGLFLSSEDTSPATIPSSDNSPWARPASVETNPFLDLSPWSRPASYEPVVPGTEGLGPSYFARAQAQASNPSPPPLPLSSSPPLPPVFRCPECQKTFAKESLLKQHNRVHRKALACEHCVNAGGQPPRFAQKRDLQRHLEAHHPETVAGQPDLRSETRACPFHGCEYTARRDNVSRHYEKKHGGKLRWKKDKATVVYS